MPSILLTYSALLPKISKDFSQPAYFFSLRMIFDRLLRTPCPPRSSKAQKCRGCAERYPTVRSVRSKSNNVFGHVSLFLSKFLNNFRTIQQITANNVVQLNDYHPTNPKNRLVVYMFGGRTASTRGSLSYIRVFEQTQDTTTDCGKGQVY